MRHATPTRAETRHFEHGLYLLLFLSNGGGWRQTAH